MDVILTSPPIIEESDYFGDFGVGEEWGDGEGELLAVDLFGDGEGKGVPFGVTFLLVGRDRVVDEGLHPVVGKIFLQVIPV